MNAVSISKRHARSDLDPTQLDPLPFYPNLDLTADSHPEARGFGVDHLRLVTMELHRELVVADDLVLQRQQLINIPVRPEHAAVGEVGFWRGKPDGKASWEAHW